MSKTPLNAGYIEQAVAPNLLDASADPEIAMTLVLANLMSDRLWECAAKLGPTVSGETEHEEAGKIQKFIDRHYEHITPVRVFEANGALDLEAESDRLGGDVVESAYAKMLENYTWRAERGTYAPQDSALDQLRQRRLPAYVYTTIDEARASRRLMGRRKHKPYGVTCCMEEAALFAALACAHNNGMSDQFAILGSPSHYTVLSWYGGELNWFYGKRSLFTQSQWATRIDDDYKGNEQLALDELLLNFDRTITGAGVLDFNQGKLTIPDNKLTSLVRRLDTFFGVRSRQLTNGLAKSARSADVNHMSDAFAAIQGTRDAAAVRQSIASLSERERNPTALRALYCYRSLDVPDHSIYLAAARRSPMLGHKFPDPTSVEAAIRQVTEIPGRESIFQDRDRIAMPDETLRFGTGTDRDKALLLHVLLERIKGEDDPDPLPVETIMTDTDSFVQGPDFCFSLQSQSSVPEITGTPVYCMRNRPDRNANVV
ncbi:MAG: hypothetical protein ABJN26_07615 [Stappiaceae bacterium]